MVGGTSFPQIKIVMGLTSLFSWCQNGIYCFITLISIIKHFSSVLLLEWVLKWGAVF